MFFGAADGILGARHQDRRALDLLLSRTVEAEWLHDHPGFPGGRLSGGFVIVLGGVLVRVPVQRGSKRLDVVVEIGVVGGFVDGHREHRNTGAGPKDGAENDHDQEFALHDSQYATLDRRPRGSWVVLTNPLRDSSRRDKLEDVNVDPLPYTAPMKRVAPWILAGLAGLALALAMPGPGWWPLVFVFPGLLLEAIERSKGRWSPWLLGWLAGTVHWLSATNWVYEVMHHYGGLPGPAAVASLVGMAMYLGIVWAVIAGVISLVPAVWRIWFFAVAWVAIDTLRRFQPYQFPWDDLAATVAHLSALLDSTAIWGASGLGWALAGIGAGLWGMSRRSWRPAATTLLIAAVGCTVSFMTLAPPPIGSGTPVRVAVLQPGTSLEEKWDPGEWQEISDRVWSMTRNSAGAEVVLWPEGAVPFRIDTDETYRGIVTELAAELDVQIVLNSIGGIADGSFANSAYLVTPDGISPARYDKVHLVPFGEYVPPWAEMVTTNALVREVGRFTPGKAATLLPSVVPLGVSICYEVVFAGHSAAAARNGAEILITLTNDGWYGHSWAPDQHFAQVRLRAAENRRWFARAALTGISGFVDPYGRVTESLEVGEQGFLIADLAPIRTLTPRARWGDWWAMLCGVAAVGLLIAGRRARLRQTGDAFSE